MKVHSPPRSAAVPSPPSSSPMYPQLPPASQSSFDPIATVPSGLVSPFDEDGRRRYPGGLLQKAVPIRERGDDGTDETYNAASSRYSGSVGYTALDYPDGRPELVDASSFSSEDWAPRKRRPLITDGIGLGAGAHGGFLMDFHSGYANGSSPGYCYWCGRLGHITRNCTALVPLDPYLSGLRSYKAHTFDKTGQTPPPGIEPCVTTTPWEHEGTICFQVEAKGVCVARRGDNNMINGTKLLNVVEESRGAARGVFERIFESVQYKHVVKIGPIHVQGTWIPLRSALELANVARITEEMYPLFVHDIVPLLNRPSNQTRDSSPELLTESTPSPPPLLGPGLSRPLQSPLSSGDLSFATPPTSASSYVGEIHGRAVALFDFERENDNELPLIEGQIILVAYRRSEGWLVAQDPKTGESGLVPEAYVRLQPNIDGTPPTAPPQDAPMRQPSKTLFQRLANQNRRASKEKTSTTALRRFSSPPHRRNVALRTEGSISPTGDKRRNKLGYYLKSVSCGHCRRRKIRCLVADNETTGCCVNCIRLKKECNFYPIDLLPDMPRPPVTAKDRVAVAPGSSTASSPRPPSSISSSRANTLNTVGSGTPPGASQDNIIAPPTPIPISSASTSGYPTYRSLTIQARSPHDGKEHVDGDTIQYAHLPTAETRDHPEMTDLEQTGSECHNTAHPEELHSQIFPQDVSIVLSSNIQDCENLANGGTGSSRQMKHATDNLRSAHQMSPSVGSSETQSEPSAVSTDSTGSYDDDSSDEEGESIASRKKRTIDRVMIEFYRLFGEAFGIRTHATNRPTVNASSQANGKNSNKTGKPSGKQSGYRSADEEDEYDEGGNGDDRSHKRRKHNHGDDVDDRRLACPYYKRNPQKYRNIHSCLGPGWLSIHRLKEHLYRRHALPPLCVRCCETFRSDAELKEHARLPTPCEIQSADPPDGFDKSQEKLLRSRKKGLFGDTKEEQWKEMYLVLFPDTLPNEIPSPFYDYPAELDQPPDPSPRSAAFAQYEAYLSRELPRSVRQELEAAMESELGPIEERLKSKLETIVRSCQERLFRTYQETFQLAEGEQQADGPSSGDPNTEAGPSTAHHPGDNISFLPFFDDLAVFQFPPDMPAEIWNDYTGCDIAGGVPSDSAYGSGINAPEPNDLSTLDMVSDPLIGPSTNNQSAAEPGPVQGYFFEECTIPDVDEIGVKIIGKGKGKARVENV